MASDSAPQRHWKRWIIGGVVVLVVAVVGGPFVYIHFIEGKAPAPLALSSQPAATVAPGRATSLTTIDGTWNVTTGSQAGYRVNEVLFGQSATAVGRTTAVTGSIAITGTTVKTGSFTVDLTKVSSDKSQRDGQFQGRIMDTSSFPTATFALTQPIALASLPASGATITEKATGNLTMHGVTKAVTFTLTGRESDNQIQVSGSI